METTYKYVHLDRTNLRQEMEQGALIQAKLSDWVIIYDEDRVAYNLQCFELQIP